MVGFGVGVGVDVDVDVDVDVGVGVGVGVDVGVPVGTVVGVIVSVGVCVSVGVAGGVGGMLQADNTQLKETPPPNLRKSRRDNRFGTEFGFAIERPPHPLIGRLPRLRSIARYWLSQPVLRLRSVLCQRSAAVDAPA